MYQIARMIRRTMRESSVGARVGAGVTVMCKGFAPPKGWHVVA
jgi:hypothetical protein